MTSPRTIAVGITGGIGSGKSEAARWFASHGAVLIDADAVARGIIDTDAAVRRRIVRAFGPESYSPDGLLDRKRMARLVFTDETLQEKLNAAVHPAVLDAIGAAIAAARAARRAGLVVVEAALLFDAGAERMLDYVAAVEAPEELRIARVMARDHSTRAAALGRIRAQMPQRETRARADFVIRNTGTLAALHERCAFLRTLLLAIAGGAAPARTRRTEGGPHA